MRPTVAPIRVIDQGERRGGRARRARRAVRGGRSLLAAPLACARALLVVLLLLSAPAAAKRLRVGVVETEDPYTKRIGLAKLVRKARHAPQDVTKALARGAVPWDRLDVLVVASFATADGDVRTGLTGARAELEDWLAKGRTLVVLAQEGRDAAGLGTWLPAGLEAAWGDRDGPGLRGVAPGSPFLAGLDPDAVGWIGDWQLAPAGGDKTAHVRGVHDAFRRLVGFRVVAALTDEGEHPALVVGRHGGGRVVLVCVPADKIALAPREPAHGAGAQRLLANLLDFAAAVREGRAPAEPPGPPAAYETAPVPRRVVVFDDRNGDGVRGPEEGPLPGLPVGHGLDRHRTDVDGSVVVRADPSAPRWIHVQSPADRRPVGAPFRRDDDATNGAGGDVLFPLAPTGRAAAAPVLVAQVTDVHVGLPDITNERVDALFAGLGRAAPAVDLILATGDLTQRGTPEEIDRWVAAQARSVVPVAPVRGNHDAGRGPDRGRSYDERVGPLYYGFDLRGLHVTVAYVADADSPEWGWVRADIEAARDRGLPTLLALHHLPLTALLATLDGLPIAAVLHGHWHGSRVVHWDEVPVIGTSTALMGGWDEEPASVRVLAFQAGRLQTTTLRYPGSDRLVRLAALSFDEEVGAPRVLVHALDPWRPPSAGSVVLERAGSEGGEDTREAPLRPVGPSTWAASFPGAAAGAARLRVTFADATETWPSTTWDVEVPARRAASAPQGTWPTFRGGPRRSGVARGGPRPPLALAWATPVGGAIHAGGPVADGERVYVNVEDREAPSPRGPASRSGVVALDRRTGRVVWTHPTDVSVRQSPTVSRGVVFFQAEDGSVTALRAEDGGALWRFDLAARFPPRYVAHWASSAPLVTSRFVVAGYHTRPVVLDRRDGHLVSTLDRQGREDAFTTSSPALSGAVLYHGGLSSGLTAYTLRPDGSAERRWRATGISLLTTPVALDESVVVHGPRGLRLLAAADGTVQKLERLLGDRSAASPLVTDDRFLAVDRRGSLVAWDRGKGRPVWRVDTAGAALARTVNAPAGSPSVSAAPVRAGGIVWFGADDGRLRAVRVGDGRVLWERDFGLPLTGGPAVAGDDLYVADLGGVVYAFR